MKEFITGYLLGQYTDRQKTGAALSDIDFKDTSPHPLDIEEAFIMYQKYQKDSGANWKAVIRFIPKKHHLYSTIVKNEKSKDTPSP